MMKKKTLLIQKSPLNQDIKRNLFIYTEEGSIRIDKIFISTNSCNKIIYSLEGIAYTLI